MTKRSYRRRFVVGFALAVALTIASGVLHGRHTQRWGPPGGFAVAKERLQSFPETIGAWELADEESLSAGVLDVLHEPGYLVRSYRNRSTGEVVKLAMLVGLPGPISVHTPDICYSSQAYALEGDPKAITIAPDDDTEASTFWEVSFEPTGLSAPALTVYYAWGTGDRWTAASNPRFTYGGEPFLYKLQLAASRTPLDDLSEGKAGRRFLQDLLASDVELHVAE